MKKSRKWLVGILGAVLLLLVVSGIAKWWAIDRHVRSRESVAAVTELHVTMRKIEYQHDCQLRNDSQVYQALKKYLTHAVYLPGTENATGGEDSRSVTIRYGDASPEKLNLTLTFYEGSGVCQVNGKAMRLLSLNGSGKKAYQTIEKILQDETEKITLTVKETDFKNDMILAEKPGTGEEYALHAVSADLQTPGGEPVKLEQLEPGDTITVLCDGYVLASYPYQVENVYRIWAEE